MLHETGWQLPVHPGIISVMVEQARQAAGAEVFARRLIERGQQQVDLAARRISSLNDVPRVQDKLVDWPVRRIDTTSDRMPRTDRSPLVRDTIELSQGSFEIRAGVKAAQIQARVEDAVLSLGRRLDVVI